MIQMEQTYVGLPKAIPERTRTIDVSQFCTEKTVHMPDANKAILARTS